MWGAGSSNSERVYSVFDSDFDSKEDWRKDSVDEPEILTKSSISIFDQPLEAAALVKAHPSSLLN